MMINQPMTFGNITIIFNGELQHESLKKILKKNVILKLV